MKLTALRQAVEEINVPCFLLCGTLLGAMRDGELMEWDDDVDLGIWEHDRHKLDAASMLGWEVVDYRKMGHDLIGWEYRLTYDDTKVDLFFLHQSDEGCWFNVGGRYHYHYPRIEGLTTVELGGDSYNVPVNWEECLVANYGPDWKTPNREWDWKEAPCCKKLSNAPQAPATKNILLFQPSYGHVIPVAANSFYRASSGKIDIGQVYSVDINTLSSQSSLLANNFNRAWCAALNRSFDYFAMLHADISCEEFWLDKLIEELERKELDVLSAVVPIKSMRGTTSTALASEDRWHPACRLMMHEVFGLPVTFTAEDVGYPLLLNTGCWVAKWGDWAKDVCFTIDDRIVHDGERYQAEVESEDWNFSRQLNKLGLKIGATRIIEAKHVGSAAFLNSVPFGDEYDHVTIKESLVLQNFLPGVDGWLTEKEGEFLRDLATDQEVLEIGTYCGRSTICMAQTAKSLLSIDPHDGRGTPKPRETLKECKANLKRYGVFDKVTLLTDRPESIDPIDFVFIDGAHDRDNVEADLLYAKAHLRKDGLIACHDYGTEPGVTLAVDAYLKNGGKTVSSYGTIAVLK